MSSTRPPTGAPRTPASSPAKGIIVVVVAVVLGVIILWRVPRSSGSGSASRTTTTTSTSTTVAATTTTQPVTMSGVKVLVVNAAGVAGAAAAVTNTLKQAGLETMPPGNAVQTGANQSAVYFADGFQPHANKVAQLLGLPAAVGPIDASQIRGGAQGAQVVVMVGKDLAGGGSSGSTSPGTTAKASTATTAKASTSTTAKRTTTTTAHATSTTKKP